MYWRLRAATAHGKWGTVDRGHWQRGASLRSNQSGVAGALSPPAFGDECTVVGERIGGACTGAVGVVSPGESKPDGGPDGAGGARFRGAPAAAKREREWEPGSRRSRPAKRSVLRRVRRQPRPLRVAVDAHKLGVKEADKTYTDVRVALPSMWHLCQRLLRRGGVAQTARNTARLISPGASCGGRASCQHSGSRAGAGSNVFRSPGIELGGRASCQDNGSALVSRSRCGESGERGAPKSSGWTSPRGEAKGVTALRASESVTAASVSEPLSWSSRWRVMLL
ncbi:hypothetical protein AK812_SmicGene44530 [Symbiodinium microadriaticum]|uniref:Uncharacterized protein n=1 Tax=Symbiodinium microadriaticum TaxID=2951 RepID=A0A1Q9BYI3_SYMMI|nr:hypothetical protein AK812_SmicGene44530 [Symbiodinium microadriaticum]